MTDEERQERVNRLKNLRTLLDSMESSRVTLIGDVMLDRYHHGYANNLNSTAPVPVLKITSSEESPGAAAHIARGLHSLGLVHGPPELLPARLGDQRLRHGAPRLLAQRG